MRRFLVIAIALAVSACGGSGDAAGDRDTDGAPTTAAVQSGSDTSSSAVDSDNGSEEPADTFDAESSGTPNDSDGSGPSTATVTLGDQTYNFSTEGAVVAQCRLDLFGIVSIQLPRVDGDGSVQIVVLHDDTDPAVVEQVNAITLDVDDVGWFADEANDMFDSSAVLEAGMSQVDSAEIDGRTVRGTATFVRRGSLVAGDEPETATGTFEATCGEERLS